MLAALVHAVVRDNMPYFIAYNFRRGVVLDTVIMCPQVGIWKLPGPNKGA